jgi:uncharacterized protein (UPF0303 family)
MTIDQDLEKIAQQEKCLQFTPFDSETACHRHRAAAAEGAAFVTIDIQLHGTQLLGTPCRHHPDNWEWVRRKRNVVLRHRSSYAVGLEHERAKTTLEGSTGLALKDYSTHGGCFPIMLAGTGCVGTITVSGLPQRDDHEMVVQVLQDILQINGEDLALAAQPES